MSQSNKHKEWQRLSDIPKGILNGSAVALNDHEFVVAAEKRDYHDAPYDQWRGIYKYNTYKHEWSEFIQYPCGRLIYNHCLANNIETNKLYLNAFKKQMIIIDTEHLQFDITKLADTKFSVLLPNNNCNAALVNVNGIIHLIGGTQNGKHWIWDDDNHCFNEIYDFKKNAIFNPTLLYVASKEKIFLIGGLYYIQHRINNNHNGNNAELIGIWTYCLPTNQWSMKRKFNYYAVSVVLTYNEEYIIIFGGKDKNRNEKKRIYVLDIRDDENYKLRKCSIKCPKAIDHNVVCIGGGFIKHEMLIIGWIKCVFQSLISEHLGILSMDIIQIISKYFSQRELHWIQKSNQINQHFVISVECVLSSMK